MGDTFGTMTRLIPLSVDLLKTHCCMLGSYILFEWPAVGNDVTGATTGLGQSPLMSTFGLNTLPRPSRANSHVIVYQYDCFHKKDYERIIHF